MGFLVISLFVIGGMFSLAAYGTPDRKKKWIYGLIAAAIWVILFVLANMIL